jgi:uncharacterized protein YjbJ (UPF0337 family)
MNPETSTPIAETTPVAENAAVTPENSTLLTEENKKQEEKAPAGFNITGEWEPRAKKLKERFGSLTDEDVKFEEGKENELIERLKDRLKKGHQEVVHIIKKTVEKES